MIQLRQPSPSRHRPLGFTLIELLVAVSLIIVLISLLVVALNQSRRAAQRVSTQALMNSISQALVRFKEDVGYLPPVLDRNRALVEAPDINLAGATYRNDIQDWYSETSLAEYLIGYDSGPNDGFGSKSVPPSDPGYTTAIEDVPFPGIRHPGADGVWGAGPGGAVAARNPPTVGNVLGPYLPLDNPRLLGALNNLAPLPLVLFPGDNGFNDPANPKVIVDAWGNPIRFYRKAYPPRALTQSYRSNVDRNGNGTVEPIERRIPTLSDVILLRPQRADEASAIQGSDVYFYGNEPFAANQLTTFELQTAEFALFSAGPDRRANPFLRVDDPADPDNAANSEFVNADNIVEISK